MRLLASLIAVGSCLAAPTIAGAAEHPSAQVRPKHGGFGFGMVGFVAGDLGNSDDDMDDPIALGSGAHAPGFGYLVGGGGGFGYGLQMRNSSAQAIQFGETRPILPGQRASYDGGFAYLDVGVGLQRPLFRGDGGFIVGLETGAMLRVGRQRWTDEDGDDIARVAAPGLTGGDLRRTLGGGGFVME